MPDMNSLSCSNTENFSLNLMHVNVQSLKNKINNLESLLYSQSQKYKILCLTEYWLKNSGTQGISMDGWYVGHAHSRSISVHEGTMILVETISGCSECPIVKKICSLSMEIHCEMSECRCRIY